MITQAKVKEIFGYEDGQLIWTQKGLKRKLGSPAGTINGNGRLQICLNKKIYLAHRLIWFWHHGNWPKKQIDHIDGNPLNNKIENLRDVSGFENHWNIGKLSTNKTGLKGVSFVKKSGKYCAQIIANKKHHWLGLFENPEDAFEAYKKAANLLHKEYKRY